MVPLPLPDEFEEEGQEAKPDRGQPCHRVKPLVHVGPELLEAPVGVSPQIIQALVQIIDPFGQFRPRSLRLSLYDPHQIWSREKPGRAALAAPLSVNAGPDPESPSRHAKTH